MISVCSERDHLAGKEKKNLESIRNISLDLRATEYSFITNMAKLIYLEGIFVLCKKKTEK